MASTDRAAAESKPTIHRQAVGVEESMPKARPGFMTSVKEKKPSTTPTGVPGESCRSAAALVS